MRKAVGLVALAVITAFLIFVAVDIRDFGSPTNSEMDDYFLANCQAETGANNVVSAIVFDYRGYDTLGEATVLFAAVSGVMVSLRISVSGKGKGGKSR